MLKATAGGGGRGIRVVRAPDELADALSRRRAPRRELAFGDPTVFLERYVDGARHVEVQIIADAYGDELGGRRARLQHPATPPEGDRGVRVHGSGTRHRSRPIRAAAVRLSEAAGYRNAGTVEFLVDPATQDFYFMEVNARLQVEHPVTEATTGLDLVKLQLHVAQRAAGWRASPRRPAATPSRCGCAPRTPSRASRRLRARIAHARACRPARACGSTPASARATRSPPSSTR